MTREAKIGLLVALAFLLVIGILLSDHVTSSTRDPLAALSEVNRSIRDSIEAPGASGASLSNPPVLPQAGGGEAQTSPYVHQQQGGEVVVTRGEIPPADAGVQAPVVPTIDWENPPAISGPMASGIGQQAQPAPGGAVNEALAEAARRAGQDVEPVGSAAQNASSAPALPAGVKEYTVQPNDSLSKITARFLGRYNKANEQIILALNPKLRANPDRISPGDKIHVPADASAAVNVASAARPAGQNAGGASAPAPAPQRAPAEDRRETAATRTYTVKPNDTLWSIAVKQLGSGARHKDILKLNAGQISDADDIRVGMKLKLPG